MLLRTFSRASRSVHAPTKAIKRRVVQKRDLNIQEYTAKELLENFGARVQKFRVVDNADQVPEAVKNLKGELVIKAQILAGGRGKGTFDTGYKGGVHVIDYDAAKATEITRSMLGNKLVTKQTAAEGVLVNKVMLAESVDLHREVYYAILMDRDSNGPVMVGSSQGGMDIEEVAEKNPESIFKEYIDINNGPKSEQLTRLAENLGFTDESLRSQAVTQMESLYKLFIDLDATQVEINPLAETKDGQVYCADAKIGFDDNAMFRHKNIYEMRDTAEEDPREVEAESHDLNYIGMTGNIGCMVNGAGLAMATMDIIKLYNGEPANFLDVGGSASEKQITEAFKIVSSDPQVKAILVNIFGGIMRCDVIAQGIVNAVKEVGLNLPLVVRLQGTNVEEGTKILADSGLPIVSQPDLDKAAQAAVASV